MPERIRIVCVVGTRPEVIKMAPVIKALRQSEWAQCLVIATAQHRGLLDQTLSLFQVIPDLDLDLMTDGQSMVDLTSKLIPSLSTAISKLGARVVLAQGDTASVFAAALVSYYAHIPFGHIEAGLRTNDLTEPFPEEGFRQMIARLACWNFAPTDSAAANLQREGTAKKSVFVTGNTGIDTLMAVASQSSFSSPVDGLPLRRQILLTAHRRESFGQPMANIFSAIRRLADSYLDVDILYPVHPNPNVRTMAQALLGNHPRIKLCDPLDYFSFVAAMKQCFFILTDSGGIQEEAPALGIPVLVLREQTERPEAIALGVAKIVGTSSERIFFEAAMLLDDPEHYRSMSVGKSPYGDGHAAPRIEKILKQALTR